MYKKLGFLLIIFTFLSACSNQGNNNNDVSEIEDINHQDESENIENSTNDVERDTFTVGDDIVIEADVHMSEENNRITVEGTSNLLMDSNVLIYIQMTQYQRPGPVMIYNLQLE